MKYSIVIPMYNEAAIIGKTIARMQTLMDRLDGDCETIFSTDGSTDGCDACVRAEGRNDPRIRLTGTRHNHGKGSAVRRGIRASKGDYVLFTDCDLAYGEEQMEGILRTLCTGTADVVIGSRALHPNGYDGYTWKRKAMSVTYHKVVCLASGFRHSDSQTGLKCFRGEAARRVFARCGIDRFAFDLEALQIAEAMGYTIAEYPVTILPEAAEEGRSSKVKPLRDTFRMLRDIRTIRGRIRRIAAKEFTGDKTKRDTEAE